VTNFTHVQTNSKHYSSLYLDLYFFGKQTVKQNIQHPMIASIPQFQSVILQHIVTRTHKFHIMGILLKLFQGYE